MTPPHDCVGELETNCVIVSANPVSGALHDDYDRDWYRVRLKGGDLWEVTVAPVTTLDAAAAVWIVGIYNSDGDFLSNDGSIVEGPQATGTAYHTASGGVATYDGVARTAITPPRPNGCPDHACYYYVVVGSYGGIGNREGHYTITVARRGTGQLAGDDYAPGRTLDGGYLAHGDDGANQAYAQLAVGAQRNGAIERNKDRDWWNAGLLEAGVQYRAVMRGTTLHDAQIGGIYNGDGDRIVSPPIDDFNVMLSFDSRLDFTVPTDGIYYIEAAASACAADSIDGTRGHPFVSTLDPNTGDIVCGKKNKAAFNNIGQYSLYLRTIS
ncbi:hypothetical protein [Candidatus Poriferisodalis sp.]|uniref:hypothetical protein n=1 Tax=Candidatus Poriferisodalis sp. TaxID=3101277 RepID=UPI003B021012